MSVREFSSSPSIKPHLPVSRLQYNAFFDFAAKASTRDAPSLDVSAFLKRRLSRRGAVSESGTFRSREGLQLFPL
jgi:hypothetical protein